MSEAIVKVCDRPNCQRRGEKNIKRYRVDMNGSIFQADLCKEHVQPLLDFVSTFPAHYVIKVRPGGRSTTGFRLHTMDEIDSMKSRGARPPKE